MDKVAELFSEMEGRVMARGFWDERAKLSAADNDKGKKSLPPWMKPKDEKPEEKSKEAPAKEKEEGAEKKSSLQDYVDKLAEGDYPNNKDEKKDEKKEAPADDKAARFEAMKEKMKAKAGK